MSRYELPAALPRESIFEQMDFKRVSDVRWRDGRAFSLAYSAGDDVLSVAEEAYRRFSGENALNVGAFPSLRSMQQDVVDVVTGWLHGDDDTAGYMTSGGTESLVLVVRAAKKRAEREGRISPPYNIVLPASAHAALEKGADYFDVESRRVPVHSDTWRADVDAMAAAVDEHTILVVGSAPQYPQGVIDPIEEIAALARDANINCHVDACMGGVTLPFLEQLGEDIPRWDFRVDGVTSISVDLHKYGYTSKGAGVLVHRNKTLRADQTFLTDNWLGGIYGSSGILGTKSGGPIASSWAVMHYLGVDGYRRATASARQSTLRLAGHIGSHPLLHLRAQPDATLLSFGARQESELDRQLRHDVTLMAGALQARDWYVDVQGPPPSIHLTVNAVHENVLEAFLSDLDAAAEEMATRSQQGHTGSAGTYASTD